MPRHVERRRQWQSLFDGKSLQGWRETPFTGRGPVRVENGSIVLGAGMPMTGVTRTGSFPHSDYEVRLEGVRRQGNDFFASMTFPVGDSFCTWVTGGWGGDIVGLSSWMGGTRRTTKPDRIQLSERPLVRARLQVSGDRIMA